MTSETEQGNSLPAGQLILYTYFRSSCSCRVRTACNIKKLPVTYRYVNLLEGEQRAASYLEVNPGGVVPTLVVTDATGRPIVTISQSIAILEYLEEAFPNSRQLLPPVTQPVARARVRELVNTIACDVQPPTNLRVLRRAKGLGVTSEDWCQEFMDFGLRAYEALLARNPQRYSVGEDITMADVVLAPAIENAMRWGMGLAKLPNVKRVFEAIRALPEFMDADWRHQEDTPEALRADQE